MIERLLKRIRIRSASALSLFFVFSFFAYVAEASFVREITGVVRDQKGEVLPGVTVLEKGTQNAVVTDGDGKFLLRVNETSAVLRLTSMGCETQEVTVGAAQTFLEIVLAEDTKLLDELVVIGYGTAKKSDLSAAVSTVPDMEQIKNRPVRKCTGNDSG